MLTAEQSLESSVENQQDIWTLLLNKSYQNKLLLTKTLIILASAFLFKDIDCIHQY